MKNRRLILGRMTGPHDPAGETFLLACLEGKRAVETSRGLKEDEVRALFRDAYDEDAASIDKRIRTARNWLAHD